MSIHIDQWLSQVEGPKTREALRKIFDQIYTDMAANKVIFDAHTHQVEQIADCCLSKAGLSIDANANDVETDNAIVFTIAGIAYTLAAQAAIDISAVAGYTPTALATAFQRIYLFHVTSAGTIGITEGTAHATAAVCPATPAGKVAFGYVKVVNASGGDFTFGTTELTAAGITATYVDLVGNASGGQELVISAPGSDTAEVAQGTATVFVNNLTT